ncbi:M20/M25/M40 family metallo-hydrolase, partial [bacterium]|nr:M20/M25/M40 family metallo-hydrolase [bacterium]
MTTGNTISRRTFVLRLAKLAGGLLLVPDALLRANQTSRWRVNGIRLNNRLAELSKFGRNAAGGASRLAFGETDVAGRAYVADQMRAADLQTHVDFGGNLIGRRKGTSQLSPLMLGSHIDSVPEGGHYDGPVGVMAAIDVAHTLHEQDYTTRHPLEIIVFCNEEGGKTGSRLISGEVMDKEFKLLTRSGKTIREGIRYIGGDPDRLQEVRRRTGDIAAYLEMHIEQGA